MSAKNTGTVRFKLNPAKLTKLSAKERARLVAMKDSDIDFSDIPPIRNVPWTRPGLLAPEAAKTQITLRVDSDVLAYFRSTGARYQSRMNAVLRAYMSAHDAEFDKRS